MELFKHDHPAFALDHCGHIVDKPCIVFWVNSTARNSNLCPECRAELCERRALRPTEPAAAGLEELSQIQSRLRRSRHRMRDASVVYSELHPEDSEGQQWMNNPVAKLNQRFFEEGVNFQFVVDETSTIGWRLERFDWGGGELVKQTIGLKGLDFRSPERAGSRI